MTKSYRFLRTDGGTPTAPSARNGGCSIRMKTFTLALGFVVLTSSLPATADDEDPDADTSDDASASSDDEEPIETPKKKKKKRKKTTEQDEVVAEEAVVET